MTNNVIVLGYAEIFVDFFLSTFILLSEGYAFKLSIFPLKPAFVIQFMLAKK